MSDYQRVNNRRGDYKGSSSLIEKDKKHNYSTLDV